MTMTYYKKLNLPLNPVKNPELLINNRSGYHLVRPEQVLTDEIMDIFSKHNLIPSFVVLFFGEPDGSDSDLAKRIIHADLQLKNNVDPENKHNKDSWKHLIFGINWELFSTTNLFSWWDMTAHEEYWPVEENLPKQYDYLNGVHYCERLGMGVPEGSIKIAETVIDGPTMVRTNVPHMTLYKGHTGTQRVGVSVRFDETSFTSWEDALEFTSKLHIDKT